MGSCCPNFEGIYTSPLSSHLPALLPPLLQAMEDSDQARPHPYTSDFMSEITLQFVTSELPLYGGLRLGPVSGVRAWSVWFGIGFRGNGQTNVHWRVECRGDSHFPAPLASSGVAPASSSGHGGQRSGTSSASFSLLLI